MGWDLYIYLRPLVLKEHRQTDANHANEKKKNNANARHSEIESYLSASWITSELKSFCSPSIKPDPELTNLIVGFVLGQSYGDFYEKQKTQGVP